MSVQDHPLGRRAQRPERLTINGEVWVRNDIAAAGQGITERSLNRGDAQGAPFAYVGGVKYRPERQYHEFLTSRIQVKGRSPQRKRARA